MSRAYKPLFDRPRHEILSKGFPSKSLASHGASHRIPGRAFSLMLRRTSSFACFESVKAAAHPHASLQQKTLSICSMVSTINLTRMPYHYGERKRWKQKLKRKRGNWSVTSSTDFMVAHAFMVMFRTPFFCWEREKHTRKDRESWSVSGFSSLPRTLFRNIFIARSISAFEELKRLKTLGSPGRRRKKRKRLKALGSLVILIFHSESAGLLKIDESDAPNNRPKWWSAWNS